MSISEEHIIKEIEQNDWGWIFFHLKKLRNYLEDKSGQELKEIPEPKFLDVYFQLALADLKTGILNEDDLINMFGVGLGQYFEERTDFKWVIYSDKYGVNLAIQNKRTNIIGFPLSSTAKRLTDKFAGNFDAIYCTLTTWKR